MGSRLALPGAVAPSRRRRPRCRPGGAAARCARRGDAGCEVGFAGGGCAFSRASASMLAERVAGKGRGEAEGEIEAFLEMMRTEPNEELGDLAALKGVVQIPNRIRCATLAWDALKRGIERRPGGAPPPPGAAPRV